MKKRIPAWTTVALAIAVPMWLAAAPAAAQSKGGTATSGATSSGGGASSGGGGHASSGGSSGGGGGHAPGGGGTSSGGGSHVSGGGSSSGSRVSSGGSSASHGSNGNNGSATSRGAVQRGPGGSSPTSANASARTGAASNDSATPRGGSRTNDANAVAGNVPPNARPRNGQPSLGTAVPRTSTTPILGQGSVFIPGFYGYYPYGYGGLGFIGGYYGGYYGDFTGGYGGYDDQYDQGYQSAPGRSDDAGGLKLKIRPAEAAVYVDGYYVGVVGDFDGVFQKLTIEPGTHRVEVRANGYETLTFEVRIENGHTTTYRGEMKKLP